MNNSELSVAALSSDAFKESRTYIYPSWDNRPEDLSQNEILSQSERRCRGLVGIEESASPIYNVLGIQEVEVRPRSNLGQLDLGAWLLCSSSIREGQWELLRKMSQSDRKAQGFGFGRSSEILKRYCDIVGSLFLLILLFPLFILVTGLIKLDSPGPIFFRHQRVGKDGKLFLLWKFRSMRADVPKYEVSPRSVVDVRLTRIGRFIRRTSIDEIPQLINVLRGEMSLVGPRPEMPFIVARYHPPECERLRARPGITGLWQISPARAFPIHENLQYDLHYVRNQNFILDCVIILRTVTAVIHGVGAV
jgi:lipopolysaccharide/colanic/teichoic acid biosynthesis glycosyltransferase